jgi:hypothetical protein
MERRNDVTKIIHANECGCTDCRLRKGESFRVVKDPETKFDPAECGVPWYFQPTPAYEYKEYRLERNLIEDDKIEFFYRFHHEGKI